jgi:hypothetical protein
LNVERKKGTCGEEAWANPKCERSPGLSLNHDRRQARKWLISYVRTTPR